MPSADAEIRGGGYFGRGFWEILEQLEALKGDQTEKVSQKYRKVLL